jgi:hypothetical protein
LDNLYFSGPCCRFVVVSGTRILPRHSVTRRFEALLATIETEEENPGQKQNEEKQNREGKKYSG